MPGCCLGALVLVFGPRLVLLAAWLLGDWYEAFDATWVAVLGWFFLPWTSLVWIFVHFHNAGQLGGGYVLLMIAGVLCDLASAGGSARARREGWERS